jgi:dTDP-4-amino-4,6-dideoxygalactose transaminase
MAETKATRIFSLPIYPHLRDDEVDEVVEVVRASI